LRNLQNVEISIRVSALAQLPSPGLPRLGRERN
jgi:hypothetical protein